MSVCPTLDQIREALAVIEACELSGGDGPFHRMPDAVATIKAAARSLLEPEPDDTEMET